MQCCIQLYIDILRIIPYLQANTYWLKAKNINPFHATDLFWYPLKISKNLWFFDVFSVYQKISVA